MAIGFDSDGLCAPRRAPGLVCRCRHSVEDLPFIDHDLADNVADDGLGHVGRGAPMAATQLNLLHRVVHHQIASRTCCTAIYRLLRAWLVPSTGSGGGDGDGDAACATRNSKSAHELIQNT